MAATLSLLPQSQVLTHSAPSPLPDYVSGGELFTHLYQRDYFTERDVQIYIAEVVVALEKLHSVRMIAPDTDSDHSP